MQRFMVPSYVSIGVGYTPFSQAPEFIRRSRIQFVPQPPFSDPILAAIEKKMGGLRYTFSDSHVVANVSYWRLAEHNPSRNVVFGVLADNQQTLASFCENFVSRTRMKVYDLGDSILRDHYLAALQSFKHGLELTRQ